MYTDVLFESANCGEKAFRLLEKKGIVDNIRYFISPARPSGLDREHFVLLLPYVMRAGNESRIKAMTEREEPLRIMGRMASFPLFLLSRQRGGDGLGGIWSSG